MKHYRTSFSALALAGVACLAPSASAQLAQQCHQAAIPLTTTNWSLSVSVPKFDPALGDLQSVTFTLTGRIEGDAKAESLDNLATVATLQFAGTITLTRPDNSQIVQVLPVANFNDPLTAFDGIIDFRGTSGITHAGVSAQQVSSLTSPPPLSDLALFTGLLGNPGSILLPVTAIGASVATGPGNIVSQFTQRAQATVEVCYSYLPNTPPSFTTCVGQQMASVGVPVSFQVCAADTNPNDTVTLTVSGLPAGATLNPPLPLTGNPACTTLTWTPASNQVGNTQIVFTATDAHLRTAACTVNIASAECHMLFASNPGSSQHAIFGHLYDTQLVGLRRFFPVTMEDIPSFPMQYLPPTFVVQLVMYNPLAFPSNPSQWSRAMRVTKDPVDPTHLITDYTGTENGIGIRATTFLDANNVRRAKFPFRVQGM